MLTRLETASRFFGLSRKSSFHDNRQTGSIAALSRNVYQMMVRDIRHLYGKPNTVRDECVDQEAECSE